MSRMNEPIQIPEIDVHEAKRRVELGAFFLDVREEDEYAQAHIAGTTLLPMSRFAADFEGALPKERQIVVHCRTGGRSANATAFLQQHGYDAVNMGGGIVAWSEQGFDVSSGD